MLNPQILSNQIISSLGKQAATVSYLKAIKDYVESNIAISATYTGVTPAGTPDPSSGPFMLSLNITPAQPQGLLLSAFLSTLKQPSPQGFLQALFSENVSDILTGDSLRTLSVSVGVIYTTKVLSSQDLDSLSKCKDHQQVWLKYSSWIVETYKTLTPILTPIPTTTATGTGITIINAVI